MSPVIKMGQVVTDSVTKVKGTVIGRTEWLTGCASVGIQRPMDKDGKVPDPFWVDETRLQEYIDQSNVMGSRAKAPKAGGPQPTPQRNLAGE